MTSNNPTFISTRSDIIKDAYAMLNVFGVDEHIDDASYQSANRILNRMVKNWMAQGYHLWLKEIAYLFLRIGQNTYSLSSSSQDHATLNYFNTTLLNDVGSGSNSINVYDSSGINLNDKIGVILSNNDLFWSTVLSKSSNTIVLATNLPLSAYSGSNVYSYTTKLQKPLEIYSADRSSNGIDVPMDMVSMQEWFEYPNKDAQSTPVSVSCDKQLNEIIVRLWQSPDNCNVIIKFVLSREIYNFDVNSDNPDFPQEWHEAIVFNLAYRLAFPYRKTNDNAYQNLLRIAQQALSESLGFDNEQNSLYLQPNFR